MEFVQGRRLQLKMQMKVDEGGELPNFTDIMSQVSKVTDQLFESDIQDYLFSWSLSLKAKKTWSIVEKFGKRRWTNLSRKMLQNVMFHTVGNTLSSRIKIVSCLGVFKGICGMG